MSEDKPFLGTGWSFPPTFTPEDDGVEMVSAREDIEQSLRILLSTSLGERVMQPEYGCNLSDYQFESIDASLIGYLKDLIENAILYHEPRIEVKRVEITPSDSLEAVRGMLKINVDYIIREFNSRYNFVYDFYVQEGVQNLF